MRGSMPKFGKMTLKPHTSSNIEKSENIVCLDLGRGGYLKKIMIEVCVPNLEDPPPPPPPLIYINAKPENHTYSYNLK